MRSLEILILRGNRIEHVDRDMFNGLFVLEYLDLSENKLQYLHPETFVRLYNVEKLYFNNNPDIKIPTDRNFIKSLSLSHLDISHCNVNSVSLETFANVSALEWLDLSYNNLRTVDINILRALPKLSTLYLYGNPLHCDCQLKEVWRWCVVHNIETGDGRRAPECETPKEVNGMGWWVLDNGQCLEDNIQFYVDYDNTRYNYTETNYKYDHDFLNHYELPVYSTFFIFGTAGNVIILFIIIGNRDMQTVPNMNIFNLAISNIIYLTLLFAETYANVISNTWLRDEFLCRFFPFCRRLLICLSAYSVALLSIQRYRAIVNPFHDPSFPKPTWRETLATIFGLWIVAALFSVPSAVSSYLCAKNDTMTPTTYYRSVVIFELLSSCVFPLCVIAFTNIMTARHLVKSSRSISEGTENPQINKRIITAKDEMALTVVFLISYVPYHVFLTYIIWTQGFDDAYPSIRVMVSYLNYGMLNLILTCLLSIISCLYPVALFSTNSPFRQHLKSHLSL
jgi:tachykinin-like receptor